MKNIFLLFFLIFIIRGVNSQVENVPLYSPVYDFLKEMSVKGIIDLNDDNPNLSRFEVVDYLKQIEENKPSLSQTENDLLNKFKVEFIYEEANEKNTWNLFGSGRGFIKNLEDFFSNKQKYIFSYGEKGNNVYVEGLGNIYIGRKTKPDKNTNVLLLDGGLRARGTIFNHLGYFFEYSKGAIIGQKDLAPLIEPRLRSDFKFNEDAEKVLSYDNTGAYIKYFVEPMDRFKLSGQIGRERLTYGYGYGGKVILNGDNPDMDFFKFSADYDMFHLSGIYASTVGYFSKNRDERYTKYYSAHRLKIAIKNVLDVGVTDVVVYNGRIEFAYLNPILFWLFAEKSLQDRDNKNVCFDFRTRFLKNTEFQGTIFIDDDEGFAILSGKTDKHQKFAYQLGAFFYEPFSLKNFSFIIEYTKIRPYTYTHYDIKNNYTAYGINLGHPIGPNADEVFTKISYNFSDWGKINLEYRFIRKGNNIFDENGNLIKNVGGDLIHSFRDGIDNEEARFLDGERVNTNNIILNFRFIPIRNYIINFYFVYNIDNNITKGTKSDYSYAFVRINIEY